MEVLDGVSQSLPVTAAEKVVVVDVAGTAAVGKVAGTAAVG